MSLTHTTKSCCFPVCLLRRLSWAPARVLAFMTTNVSAGAAMHSAISKDRDVQRIRFTACPKHTHPTPTKLRYSTSTTATQSRCLVHQLLRVLDDLRMQREAPGA